MTSRYLPTILLLLSISSVASAEDSLRFLGSYDNVESSTGEHCNGTSISLWQINDGQIIGLLDIHSGLCGDPPCSILRGSINSNSVSFNTSVPVYNELYSFTGKIINTELTGSLNSLKTTFHENSFKLHFKDITSWCSLWSKVSRCSGVKEYCQ